MNTPINDGGPAFPTDHAVQMSGMYLRDYFAAKAMEGFAADPKVNWVNGVTGMASRAYEWADAMLRTRSL